MTINSLVFAGGGNRCFWQAGFWHTYTQEVEVKPKAIASVSAGSAVSCALFAGKILETLEITKEVMSRNAKNRYLSNLFSDEPVYPHSHLYRHIIHQAINENDLEKLRQGPENRILLAHIPAWLGPCSAVLVGLGAYQLEKKLSHPVHPVLGRKLGFRSEFVMANQAQSIAELSDIILSSSCTPPFTPIMYRHGKPVLDGGLVDNVPVHGVDNEPGQMLVLLSRPYKQLPNIPNRTYIQPSKPVPAVSWDYTNPEAVQATFDQGVEDAKRYLQHMDKSEKSLVGSSEPLAAQ